MILSIRQSTVSEIFGSENIEILLDEYANESAIAGLPHPKAKIDLYHHLESVDAIYIIGAFLNDILIGFILILSPVLPHYSAKVSVSESFFVAEKHRKTGAGLRLLKAGEDYAKKICSLGLLVSTPYGGNLAEIMPRLGYSETNRVFFKGFVGE